MNKRQFIKIAGVATAGTILAPTLTFCSNKPGGLANNSPLSNNYPFAQAALPYAYNALEPHIDEVTMEIHYSKHHAGYTKKLNEAIEGNSSLQGKSIEDILGGIKPDSAQLNLRNNAGGYYNHNLYWEWMKPGGHELSGALVDAINGNFGSFVAFKTQFIDTAKSQFGSGWTWLILTINGELKITSTPNQDNPLMTYVVEESGYPLLGIDIWEHAYYLKHQNMRVDYIAAFFELINWDVVSKRFEIR